MAVPILKWFILTRCDPAKLILTLQAIPLNKRGSLNNITNWNSFKKSPGALTSLGKHQQDFWPPSLLWRCLKPIPDPNNNFAENPRKFPRIFPRNPRKFPGIFHGKMWWKCWQVFQGISHSPFLRISPKFDSGISPEFDLGISRELIWGISPESDVRISPELVTKSSLELDWQISFVFGGTHSQEILEKFLKFCWHFSPDFLRKCYEKFLKMDHRNFFGIVIKIFSGNGIKKFSGLLSGISPESNCRISRELDLGISLELIFLRN